MSRIAILAAFFMIGHSASIPTVQRSEECPVILDPQRPLSDESKARGFVMGTERNGEPRIVGGDLAGKDLTRYMATVISNEGLCSGALIAPRVVLTAAHCGITVGNGVYLGGSEVFDGTRIDVENVTIPPEYRSTSNQYGFMVLTLSRDAPGGSGYMLVNMNESVPLEGSVVRAAGYGVTKEDEEEDFTRELRQVDMPVASFSVCRDAYESIDPIVESLQVCAGYSQGGCDSCRGDSGGPLIQYDRAGRPVIVGVTSFGLGCARSKYPGVYTRTNIFRSLLLSIADFNFTNQTNSVFTSPSPIPDPSLPKPPAEGLAISPTIIIIIAAVGAAVAVGIIVLLIVCVKCK